MEEGKLPRVVDVNGYVLSEEEVRLEMELYKKAGISFLCGTCRGIVGTNDYKEFLRRRNMTRPLTPALQYVIRDGRPILVKEHIEGKTRTAKSSKRKWILQSASIAAFTTLGVLNDVHVKNSSLQLLFFIIIFAGFIVAFARLEFD